MAYRWYSLSLCRFCSGLRMARTVLQEASSTSSYSYSRVAADF